MKSFFPSALLLILISLASCEEVIPGSGIAKATSVEDPFDKIMEERPGHRRDADISNSNNKPVNYDAGNKNNYIEKENSNIYLPNNHLVKDDLSKPERDRFNNVPRN